MRAPIINSITWWVEAASAIATAVATAVAASAVIAAYVSAQEPRPTPSEVRRHREKSYIDNRHRAI